jgi:hypothetical protein
VIELPDAHHVGCRCHEAVQKLLCGVLRNVVGILKLGETSSKQLCHKFMTYLLSLLKKFLATYNIVSCKEKFVSK